MIPKNIHIVWNHKEVLNSKHPLIENGLHKLIELNPDWKASIYTPNLIENDLKNVLSSNDYDLIKNRHFVSKIDLWRLFKMYFEGGLYMDIDRLCNVPLSSIIDENITWVCPTSDTFDVSCDFLLSAPRNPIFIEAANLYLQRLNDGYISQYFLGPQTYMHAVTSVVCGKMIDTNPGKEGMDYIREKINSLPFAKTYIEFPPNDTIIYQGDLGNELENMKRDFYAKEGVKHWTGEW